jgi:large subunit ribosomal protein L28
MAGRRRRERLGATTPRPPPSRIEVVASSRTKAQARAFKKTVHAKTAADLRYAAHGSPRNFLTSTRHAMARKDDLTGKGPVTGNNVSRSNNKTKRRFQRNLQKKRFYIPSEDRWITLKVSAKTLKTINKNGIEAVLREARKQGVNV